MFLISVKVVVLTTSYPRDEDDVAGHFVRAAVEGARAAGVDVEVVSPASFRHFGLAYGHGIVGNLRRRPWLALMLPAFLLAFVLWGEEQALKPATGTAADTSSAGTDPIIVKRPDATEIS